MSEPIYGAIEAGGTKFICAAGRPGALVAPPLRLPTTTPDQTLRQAIGYFQAIEAAHGPLASIGIASFGPAQCDRAAPQWGHILATPKPGWSHCDLAGTVGRALALPVGFDTDVNAAALAEHRHGALAGARLAVYVTVGTGIGGGIVADGRIVHGASHPEMGHILPRRHPDDGVFAGVCPFHGDCLEGLASGPAIAARWGASLSALGADHPAQAIIAFYLGQLVLSLRAVLSAQRIVLGGGVMDTPGLIDRVRAEAERLGAGYGFGAPLAATLLSAPGLGSGSGLTGAFLLAQEAAAAPHHHAALSLNTRS